MLLKSYKIWNSAIKLQAISQLPKWKKTWQIPALVHEYVCKNGVFNAELLGSLLSLSSSSMQNADLLRCLPAIKHKHIWLNSTAVFGFRFSGYGFLFSVFLFTCKK